MNQKPPHRNVKRYSVSKELSVLAATIERLVRDEADMLLNVH